MSHKPAKPLSPCAIAAGRWLAALLAIAVLLLALPAQAKVHRVRSATDLVLAAMDAQAGDVVEVMAGPIYNGGIVFRNSGTAERPIVVRGVKVDGKRPVISGGDNTVEAQGDHTLFESLELTGGRRRCFFHHAHAVVLRDMLIHDCPKQGILSADDDSGSLTVEYSELYRNGHGDYDHQIYATSDQRKHPGSVFRLQYSYIHNGNGGNNVKSRAERNEIYFNWIEGAFYHELELIGPDVPNPTPIREDSDVVGNVLRNTNHWHLVRVGGDGTMDTNGRYRFVHNTFVVPARHRAVFRLFDGVESIEMHNNAFTRDSGRGGVTVLQTKEVRWTHGRALIAGHHNFVPAGSFGVPSQWSATVRGASAKLTDVAAFDLRPAEGSPLRDAAKSAPQGVKGFAFPSPRTELGIQPARRQGGVRAPRQSDGKPDIGAYEGGFALTAEPAPITPIPKPAPPPSPPPAAPKPSAVPQPAKPVATVPPSRCGCRIARPHHRTWPFAALALLGLAGIRRRSTRQAQRQIDNGCSTR